MMCVVDTRVNTRLVSSHIPVKLLLSSHRTRNELDVLKARKYAGIYTGDRNSGLF